MQFVIIGHDARDGQEKRVHLRPAHLAHLGDLDRQGRIVLAGPFTDGAGSLIVVSADSLEEAWEMVASDPYVRNGVFESVEVRPFKQVLPNPA